MTSTSSTTPPASTTTTTTTTTARAGARREHEQRIRKAIGRRSFAVVSTVSAAGHPHAAGVLFANDGLDLYISTHGTSRKARNVAANGRAAVVIPVRKLPIGPAFEIQFQAAAKVLANDDPRIVELRERGVLKAITSHGELDEPDTCFLELRPTGRLHSYGIGAPLVGVARDPLHVGPGMIDLHSDEFLDPRQRPSR